MDTSLDGYAKAQEAKFSLIFTNMKSFIFVTIFSTFFLFGSQLSAQKAQKTGFFMPADTLNKARAYTLIGGTSVGYAATMIGLNAAWYADFERSGFHLFNDWGEWNDMDKVGHLYSAYNESLILMYGGLWAGMPRKKAMWMGVGFGALFQTSIEVLDGFSEKWGFSIGDMAFNTGGLALLAAQELAWQEQRITLKLSAHPVSYPRTTLNATNGQGTTTVADRAAELYGEKFYETFLKDYNGQTLWASVNIRSFLKKEDSKIPRWLNIAVGYGAENLLGGFANTWTTDGLNYTASPIDFTRRRQFYLSFDIDFTRIKSRKPFLKGLLICLNALKFPAPTLEWNTHNGGFRFYPIYF